MHPELSGDRSWLFDLVCEDEHRRAAVLTRHRESLEAAGAALHRLNAARARAGSWAPEQAHLSAEMDQARAAMGWNLDQTLCGPVAAFTGLHPSGSVAHVVYAPFAVLFLRWEARYPVEWREPGSWWHSPWTTKAAVLERFAAEGVPDEVLTDLTGLVAAAVRRPYRCKDWHYAGLVRHIPDALLRGTLAPMVDAVDPLTRLRVQFLVDLLDDPGQRVTRRTWRRWLATGRNNGLS
ncbi:hypothetical protein ACTMTJ_43665 [Phytohabitans sp. LJ34]|uniref:hypothetical protein n=1 Tax=Phytohabitans sp. LJ34 TaxID=3452217 RepID=UPI003F8B782E